MTHINTKPPLSQLNKSTLKRVKWYCHRQGRGQCGRARGEVSSGLSWCFINWFLQLWRFQVSKNETFSSLNQSVQFAPPRKAESRLLSIQLLDLQLGAQKEAVVGLYSFAFIWSLFVAGLYRHSVRSLQDNEQFSVLHPPCSGWVHAHLILPAEEPARSSQEEMHSLLLHTHLTQRR